jgi:hypothetical protein
MWTVKTFKTKQAMETWIERHGNTYQYREVFVNNAYALDVRRLRIIG